MNKDMVEKKYWEWDKHVQVDVYFLLKSSFSNTSRNTSGKAAGKNHTRRPDEAQISEVQEKFPSNSKSLTAALASSQSVRFQWKRDHTLILSHQKCHRSPVMLDFDFFFLSPSFSLSFYILTVTAEGCQELGGCMGGWVGGAELLPTRMHIKGTSSKWAICPAWPALLCYPLDDAHIQ